MVAPDASAAKTKAGQLKSQTSTGSKSSKSGSGESASRSTRPTRPSDGSAGRSGSKARASGSLDRAPSSASKRSPSTESSRKTPGRPSGSKKTKADTAMLEVPPPKKIKINNNMSLSPHHKHIIRFERVEVVGQLTRLQITALIALPMPAENQIGDENSTGRAAGSCALPCRQLRPLRRSRQNGQAQKPSSHIIHHHYGSAGFMPVLPFHRPRQSIFPVNCVLTHFLNFLFIRFWGRSRRLMKPVPRPS